MNQYEFIRTAKQVCGKNISELSRMTGLSRNTIKKALREEFSGYRVRRKQPFPVPGPYLEIIDDWLRCDLLPNHVSNGTQPGRYITGW